MTVNTLSPRRLPRAWPRLSHVGLAALAACAFAPGVQADEGDAPLGIERAVTLPAQAKGNPPVWAGKAFRQGVVSVANRMRPKPAPRCWSRAATPSTRRWPSPTR